MTQQVNEKGGSELPRYERNTKRPGKGLLLKLVLGVVVLYALYYRFLTSWSTTNEPRRSHCHVGESSAFGLASTDLNWLDCGDRFQCANLSVPLDYTSKEDKRTASIAIVRYLASNKTSTTGTVIFNPGGPGGSGTGSTYRLGPVLDKVLEGQYDILGFDRESRYSGSKLTQRCMCREPATLEIF
jgi:hypothetical protein